MTKMTTEQFLSHLEIKAGDEYLADGMKFKVSLSGWVYYTKRDTQFTDGLGWLLDKEITHKNKYTLRTKEEYQEALRSLIKWCPETDEKKNIDLLKELIDRAKPKKPLIWNGCPKCPKCFNFLVSDSMGGYYNCCQECGQALDWGREAKR